MMCSPCNSDSPLGVHGDPPGEVSWTDDDPESSHFSANSEGTVVHLNLQCPKKKNLTRVFCSGN